MFKEMFRVDMEENEKNELTIDDIEEKVFEELLRSIYTSKLNCINDVGDKLIVAAEKYQLNRLKEECEDALINNISIDNCLDYLK